MSLSVTNLDHCSVIITDVARSRHFYRELLGLKEIAPPNTFDFIVAWFDLGGGQTLHLLLKPHPDVVSPRHFALGIRDANAAREDLRAKGVSIEETTPIPNCDRFFIRDPDGNRIELIYWLKPFNPERDGRYLV